MSLNGTASLPSFRFVSLTESDLWCLWVSHVFLFNTKKSKINDMIWLSEMFFFFFYMYIYEYVTTKSLKTLITTTTTTLVKEAKVSAEKRKSTVTDEWTRKDGTNIWKWTKVHIGHQAAKAISTLENGKKKKKKTPWVRAQKGFVFQKRRKKNR